MSPTSGNVSQLKKHKKERACDACRRRKTKCDGPFMPSNICTNCTQSRKPCTYVEASKPRSPPKAYVTGLEDKLEAMEAILKRIQPDVDFSDELGPPVIRNSWKTQDDSSPASSSNAINRTSSFASAGLSPIMIPFHSDKAETVTLNPEVFPPPVSTHLVFHSQPRRARQSRILSDTSFLAYRDNLDLTEDSDTETSSSSETEEIVITSIVGRTKITLRASENDDSDDDNNIRFHGRSSTAGLVETTRQFKHMHMRDTLGSNRPSNDLPVSPDNRSVAQTRRPQFWQTPVWESQYEGARGDNPTILRDLLRKFPPPDLMEILIDLYFRHSNTMFPLLHRPTFDRQWKSRLYHRNIWFAGACSSIFAIGSRWCSDKRVLREALETQGQNLDWRRAGSQYFEIALDIHRIRRNLFHPAIDDILSKLMSIYLKGTSSFPTAWFFISGGIRKAQDIGAHRKKVYQTVSNIDDELWKRAFWHLVVFDRLGGVSLGRACGMGEEDFDLDLPLEVDDAYLNVTQKQPFKQPTDIPSSITAFNELIKLTQIMAFTLKTLYATDKSRIYRGLVPLKRQSLVDQLSIALEEWKEGLPEHLRWRERMDNPVFSCQAATLLNTYHVARMLVHRPSITALALPSSDVDAQHVDFAFSVCIDAATSCADIIKTQLQRGIEYIHIPNIIDVSHMASAFLVVNTWYLMLKQRRLQNQDIKPHLAQKIDKTNTSIQNLLRVLEELEDRWGSVGCLMQDLQVALPEWDEFEPPEHFVSNARANRQFSPKEPAYDSQNMTSTIHDPPIKNRHLDSRSNSSLRNRHSIAELPSLSHLHRFLEPLPLSHSPSVPHSGWLPPIAPEGQQAEYQRHDMRGHLLIGARARALSATTSNVSWNDQTLPFISSMRRTSTPNLTFNDHQHVNRDSRQETWTSSIVYHRPHLPESTRYEDVDMRSEDDDYALTPRYDVQPEQRRSSPIKIYDPWPYDRRGHR
uniref:Zn(2)-C6 fungal-type domain-containing protein n=1 Tax=Psilocybe cubensis TaxID=181762 RepID=A0A8H7Y582_PSICU